MPRPSLNRRWYTVVEARIYSQQYNTILAECGKDAADSANYGWGVSEYEGYIGVETKVYGYGVIESEARRGIGGGWGTITHDWI